MQQPLDRLRAAEQAADPEELWRRLAAGDVNEISELRNRLSTLRASQEGRTPLMVGRTGRADTKTG